MRKYKQIAIALLGLCISLPLFGDDGNGQMPNPILEEILRYDVIFKAKYNITDGEGRFIVQEQLKGENTKLILEYVRIAARMSREDGDEFLFMFSNDDGRRFCINRLNWAKRICRWEKRRYWCVSINDIKQSLKE